VDRLKSFALLLLGALAFVLVPYLFWKQVWFGTVLDDQALSRILNDEEKPRAVQHALSQIVARIESGDPRVEEWYGAVCRQSANPHPDVRIAAAWAMGHDPRAPQFHETLIDMLEDDETMVRRNAALALVRFGDRQAIPELRTMLHAQEVTAPADGTVHYLVKSDEAVARGTVVASMRMAGDSQELVSQVPGRSRRLVDEGTTIEAGDALVELEPEPIQVWESLRALYLIGGPEEIELVQSILDEPHHGEAIHRQAKLTLEAIHSRTSSSAEIRKEKY
jgi:biotin carboxyl carrier protein